MRTNQSNPVAKEASMVGAMSLAAVMMYFSARSFLRANVTRGQEVRTWQVNKSSSIQRSVLYGEVTFFLQISLHLVQFVVLNGLDDHIWAGIVLRETTRLRSYKGIVWSKRWQRQDKWTNITVLTLDGRYLSSSSMPRGTEMSFWKAFFILSLSPMA